MNRATVCLCSQDKQGQPNVYAFHRHDGSPLRRQPRVKCSQAHSKGILPSCANQCILEEHISEIQSIKEALSPQHRVTVLPACVLWASTALQSSSRPPASTISALMASLLASCRSSEQADRTSVAFPKPAVNTCNESPVWRVWSC